MPILPRTVYARLIGTALLLCAGVATPMFAQVIDGFSDGDFQHDPPWTGDVNRWTVEVVDGDPALAANGVAAADTIQLSVALGGATARWTFDFSHRDVNLSTFNGARVFICADSPDVRTHPSGYYVQIGTNNGDAVSLWRVDGDWSTRQELGRSIQALIEGDSSRLHVEVQRDVSDRWQVLVDDEVVLEAYDTGYDFCSHLALWVKHSIAGRSSFVFDTFTAHAPATPAQPPAEASPDVHEVVINEIHFDPPPAGSEFVELLNRSTETFQLDALTLRDAASSPAKISGEPIRLAPDEYAVLVQNGTSFQDQFRTVPYVVVSPWPTLNNAGDVVLLESAGVVIDSVSYDGTDADPDRSLERMDPDGPSDRYNFGPSVHPFGATPGARNSRFERDLEGPRLEYAQESADGTLDLFFDEPVRVDSTSHEAVMVGTATASSVSRLSADALRATFHGALGASHVRIDVVVDRRGNRSEQLTSPIAFRPKATEVVVNEILYEPLADRRDGVEDQVEFVELLNRSDRSVHLDGLLRTRDPDERGDADTMRVSGRRLLLAPKGLVLLAGEPVPGDGSTVITPSLTLLNHGDVLRLLVSDSLLLDEVRYSPSWHHPDLLDRRGVSLERIDPGGSSSDPANWTSSVDPLGATPGRQNSVRLPSQAPTPTAGLTITPNPFSPDRDGVDDVVKITCVPGLLPARARLRIFDLSGLMVREVVPAQLIAGPTSFLWDGRDHAGRRLRTGIYIAVLDVFDARSPAANTFKQPFVLARRY